MKAKSIIHSILEENAVKAKKIIAEDLTIKLGQRLAEEYVRVAKETFNEEMDPVGKEDEDIDNDGDSDESDEYLSNRRKAIGKAMSEEEGEEEGEEGEEEGEDETVDMPTKPFDVRLSYNG